MKKIKALRKDIAIQLTALKQLFTGLDKKVEEQNEFNSTIVLSAREEMELELKKFKDVLNSDINSINKRIAFIQEKLTKLEKEDADIIMHTRQCLQDIASQINLNEKRQDRAALEPNKEDMSLYDLLLHCRSNECRIVVPVERYNRGDKIALQIVLQAATHEEWADFMWKTIVSGVKPNLMGNANV